METRCPTPEAGRPSASCVATAALSASREKVGASIDVLFSDCPGCEDISAYRLTCLGDRCLASSLLSRTATSATLAWTSVRKGEALSHQPTLWLKVKAIGGDQLELAIDAVRIPIGRGGPTIPLRHVLEAAG